MTLAKPRIRIKMGRQRISAEGPIIFMVIGNCGIPHTSTEWSACRACDTPIQQLQVRPWNEFTNHTPTNR